MILHTTARRRTKGGSHGAGGAAGLKPCPTCDSAGRGRGRPGDFGTGADEGNMRAEQGRKVAGSPQLCLSQGCAEEARGLRCGHGASAPMEAGNDPT